MIYVSNYQSPEIARGEVLRYAGVRGDGSELEGLLNDCIQEANGKLVYKVCYGEFDISLDDAEIDLGFAKVTSSDLKKNLSGCDRVIVFAATVGIEIDRLIARYSSVSPSRSLMLQALGSERIEALCNAFCRDISKQLDRKNELARPRFSAGYGDLPLTLQRDIFAALDCPRRIGLTLNESLLMSPSKSVTAIIGIAKK